jgi:hypothetical protein
MACSPISSSSRSRTSPDEAAALPEQAVRGVWTTFGVSIAAAIYLLATWSDSLRLEILTLWGLAFVTSTPMCVDAATALVGARELDASLT